METAKKERASNFELLRIVAMLMIVFCHYVAHGVRHCITVSMSSEWLSAPAFYKCFSSFLIPGGTVGVGVFFLLTGYFMYSLQMTGGGII